ncbi:MAG TPA: translocation/assembly module TamB domain-containing protein, partial [Candidatus Binataceae bacterium]|nr:translocation/assembly module TamB domain-containing protein [Candidatus Binataceae bacterium]
GEISANATTTIAGGQITARGSITLGQRTYNGQITSTNVHLDHLEVLNTRDINAQGVLAIDASGKGSFDNPQMDGRISIGNASVQGHAFSRVDLHVNLANREVSADISSKIANATLRGHGKLGLTGNYPLDASLDTETLPLQPLLALYSPDIGDDITGHTQVHLEVHGPLTNRQALTAEIVIPVLDISYKNMANLAAAGPVRVDYQQGILHVQPVTFQGTGTKLQLQGAIPLYSNAPPSIQLLGNVNLQVARMFDPDLRSSGMARIDIHSGNTSRGGLAGQIELVGANVAYGSFPVGLNNANGVLTLSGNRIDVTKFTGNIGGGTVTAQGGVALRPKLAFDLGLAATNVRMLYPVGMRETLNADLRFTGSTERALLGGTVGISDISFTPAFDLTSMISQFSSRVAAPTAPGFSQNIFLNVAIHSTNVLSPSSRTMSVAGTAALTLRGTAEQPALVGRVNLTGGSMIFNGDRFVVTGGTIQFVDPHQIRPVLNVTLTTTIQQYDIDLRFTGPTDQLRGEFTSNPSLPRADIISLLALGTTTEAQAANPTPASQNAESKVASQVSSQVTSRISKIAGISQLSISPVLTSGTAAGPPGAVITIRQQVTGNLFITFSSNVASTQDQTIQGEYRLSPRVSVSATRDPNGGFAVDTLIRKSW